MKVPSIQSIVKWINADYIYRQKIENQKQMNDHNGSYNFLFECEANAYLHKNEIRNCKIVKTKIQTETYNTLYWSKENLMGYEKGRSTIAGEGVNAKLVVT